MVLVDTSVWIDHLRSGDATLASLLDGSRVLVHPFVIGELACGNLQNREEIIRLLNDLPQASVASQQEMLQFIEYHQLMGRGIGFIDAHLLAATTLENQAQLWTRDARLAGLADRMQVVFQA